MPHLKLRLKLTYLSLMIRLTFQLSATKIDKGSEVTIELKPKTSGERFKGFLIQARSVDGDDIIGTLEQLDNKNNTKYLQCSDTEPHSALTHTDPTSKESVKLKWTPPQDFSGKVKVLATLVKDFKTYWVKLESETLEV